MKCQKLYNVIFPIWFIWIFPPVFLIALAGNFIIDSAVLVIAALVFKTAEKTGASVKDLYKGSIVKVWSFGFLADIIGSIPLFLIVMVGVPGIGSEVKQALALNPWSHPVALVIMLSCMVLASVFIYFFNYRITFRETIADRALRAKLALTLAIVTTPWVFLVPTQWLYRGF